MASAASASSLAIVSFTTAAGLTTTARVLRGRGATFMPWMAAAGGAFAAIVVAPYAPGIVQGFAVLVLLTSLLTAGGVVAKPVLAYLGRDRQP